MDLAVLDFLKGDQALSQLVEKHHIFSEQTLFSWVGRYLSENRLLPLQPKTIIIYAMAEKNLNRIKVMLAEKGKTNKWLAEKLGRDQATISKWCTNACQPPLEALIQIAQCLEVDIKELIRVPEHNPYKEL